MYIFKGVKRVSGEYKGYSYDKLRFCFLRSSSSSSDLGFTPVIFDGKLPYIKTSEFSDVCPFEFGELSKFLDRDCIVECNRFGKIIKLDFEL